MGEAKLETQPFDAADYLETAEDVRAYLEAAFEDEEPAEIAAALGVVARSKGMTEIAKASGVSRDGLYKSLSETGNPSLSTLIGVMSALGVKLTVKAA